MRLKDAYRGNDEDRVGAASDYTRNSSRSFFTSPNLKETESPSPVGESLSITKKIGTLIALLVVGSKF